MDNKNKNNEKIDFIKENRIINRILKTMKNVLYYGQK